MINVIWFGPTDDSGIGRAGRGYLSILSELTNVRLISIGTANKDFKYLENNSINGPFVIISHGLPSIWDDVSYINSIRSRSDCVRRILFTVWETIPFPESKERELIERYDEIIVPSRFSSKAFPNSKPKIVEHLIDRGIRNGATRNHRRRAVIVLSQNTQRKGIDLIAPLLKRLKTSDIEFIVKTCDFSGIERIRKDLDGESRDGFWGIGYHMTDDALNNLYETSHYFISLSRGEGFGFSAHDAAINGCIPVLPKIEDHWCDEGIMSSAIMYECDDVPAGQSTYDEFGIDINVSESSWIEPNIEDIAKKLSGHVWSESRWDGNRDKVTSKLKELVEEWSNYGR